MNEKELLQRFVELAPKGWGAQMSNTSRCLWASFITDGHGTEGRYNPTRCGALHLGNDFASAGATIFLLDWLEQECIAGALGAVDTVLARDRDRDGDYVCQQWLVPNADTPVVMHEGQGKTRIEAVLRAVVAILAERSTKGHSQPGNERGTSRTKKKTVDPVEGGER